LTITKPCFEAYSRIAACWFSIEYCCASSDIRTYWAAGVGLMMGGGLDPRFRVSAVVSPLKFCWFSSMEFLKENSDGRKLANTCRTVPSDVDRTPTILDRQSDVCDRTICKRTRLYDHAHLLRSGTKWPLTEESTWSNLRSTVPVFLFPVGASLW